MCPLFKFFRMINGYFDVTIDACNGGLSQALRALRSIATINILQGIPLYTRSSRPRIRVPAQMEG